ncbi:hypothetical protein [Cyanobacterium aponinum]|uniref:Uncharacterized protein n=1 Tax=Cyanobacterium aponinum (strain PCC 10605) TaxID=755178 RepID=K9Z3T5_CYAAP|nr:hypothetical protein [Cyanobacterium aponinum]AFZ53225.1 hypothetical protein Cyan10605_1103 [Cyanobacterium aponinum PCC 10605]
MEIIYQILLKLSQFQVRVVGDHHGSLFMALIEIYIPINLTLISSKDKIEIPAIITFLMLISAIFFILFSIVVSSPQFWIALLQNSSKNWFKIILIQLWFVCLLFIWITALKYTIQRFLLNSN